MYTTHYTCVHIYMCVRIHMVRVRVRCANCHVSNDVITMSRDDCTNC